jgi:hypothetical protein
MAKKQLFETNPLESHPMFSDPKPAASAEKNQEAPAVKKTTTPLNNKIELHKPKPEQDTVEHRKSTFYLTNDIHKNLKLFAVQNDIDISVLVRQIFTDFFKKKGVAL